MKIALDTKQRAIVAKNKQKGNLIADNTAYRVTKIPLNWQVYIKLPKRHPNYGIDRYVYLPLWYELQDVHRIANETIDEYFIRKHTNKNIII